ncbi:MAG: ribosome maturation factor RimP [Rhodothermales bacterium]
MSTPPLTLDDRVLAATREVLAGSEAFLVHHSIRGHKGTRTIEIFVDSQEALGVDRIARISRDLGFLLETEEIVDGKYNLIVSTPGLDRALVDPRQFLKNIGRAFKLKMDTDEGTVTKTGTLVAADTETATFEWASGGQDALAYADFYEAKVQLPW